MNEPLINPWIFYMVDVLNTFRQVIGAIAIIGVGVIGTWTIIGTMECGFKEMLSTIRKYKRFVICICIAGLLTVFIPAQDTIYKMIAATYITQENIENVGESIDKIADKLVEKINQVKK